MTIRKIAAKTGLSTTTVCKALKNPSSVRPSTWKIIENAQGLEKSGIISEVHLIIPDLANLFFVDFLSGAINALRDFGMAPCIHLTYDDSKKEKNILAALTGKNNLGIIWIPGAHSGASILPQNFPASIVLCDRDIRHSGIKRRILLDNRFLAFQAVQYLCSKQARSICFINGPEESYTAQQRKNGAQEAADLARVSLSVFHSDFIEQAVSCEMVKGFFNEEKFDAYLLGNQAIAYGFLRALKDTGRACPPCIAFDKLPSPELLSQAISYIILPSFSMGERSVSMLMENNPRDVSNIIHTIQGSLHIF